jgi:protein SCO1/2
VRALLRVRALLLAALLGAAPAAAEAPALRAGVFEPPRPAPAFTLAGSDGSELTLARYKGKVVILAFGFTSCPDVCPTTLGVLARTRKDLGAQASDLQIVYVTVDPEHDDTKRMKDYLAKFDPTFVGATGDAAALEAVRKEYGIAAEKVAGGTGYSHSSFTYLIDRAGSLRALMPYGHVADDYVHDVRILLAN